MRTHAALLCLALLSCNTEQGPAVVDFAPTKGTTAHFQKTSKTVQSIEQKGQSTAVTIETTAQLAMKVVEVTPSGEVVVEVETDRVQGSVLLPSDDVFTFDSEAPKEVKQNEMITLMIKAETAFTAAPLVVTLDKRGRVLSCRGGKGIQAALNEGADKDNPSIARSRLMYADSFENDHLAQTVQSYFVQLPAEAIGVGSSWSPEPGVHECDVEGQCANLPTTSTVTASYTDEIAIDTTVSLQKEPAATGTTAVSTTFERSATLSRGDSLPIAMSSELRKETVQRDAAGEIVIRNIETSELSRLD